MKIIHSYSTKKKSLQLVGGKDIVRLDTSLAICFLLIAFPAIFSVQKTLSRRWSLEEVLMCERSLISPVALLQPGHTLTHHPQSAGPSSSSSAQPNPLGNNRETVH